jgi:hypothetical protein
MNDQIRQLLHQGGKIEAIKFVREQTGAGLKDAKEYVESVGRGENPPQPPPAPARTGMGCTSVLLVGLAMLAAGLWSAQAHAQQHDNDPIDPFPIAGNLYYVGSSDIGSYLVATPPATLTTASGCSGKSSRRKKAGGNVGARRWRGLRPGADYRR